MSLIIQNGLTLLDVKVLQFIFDNPGALGEPFKKYFSISYSSIQKSKKRLLSKDLVEEFTYWKDIRRGDIYRISPIGISFLKQLKEEKLNDL